MGARCILVFYIIAALLGLPQLARSACQDNVCTSNDRSGPGDCDIGVSSGNIACSSGCATQSGYSCTCDGSNPSVCRVACDASTTTGCQTSGGAGTSHASTCFAQIIPNTGSATLADATRTCTCASGFYVVGQTSNEITISRTVAFTGCAGMPMLPNTWLTFTDICLATSATIGCLDVTGGTTVPLESVNAGFCTAATTTRSCECRSNQYYFEGTNLNSVSDLALGQTAQCSRL